MKNRTLRILILLTALICICAPALHAEDSGSFKKITIYGLEIFTADELCIKLDLNSFPVNESAYREAARRINNFYYKHGYYLAITYRMDETSDTLSMFVDEGRIGQIIVKGLDDITLIRIKADFTLKKRIYNRAALDKEILRIKNKYGFKEMRSTLVASGDYSENFIQLDGVIQFPFLGDMRVPLFERYGYRYNLIIEPQLYSAEEASKKKKGLQYGIKLYYLGIIPKIKYRHPSLLAEDDSFEASASCGLTYFSDFNPKNPPAISFVQTGTAYNIRPMFGGFFTPRISADSYYSKSGRPDIGLVSYEYVRSAGNAEPGITLLSQFKIFIGAGFEKIFLFKTLTDSSKNADAFIAGDTRLWYTLSARVELDRYFGMLYSALERDVNAKYTFYFDGTTFHKFDFTLNSDFNARKLDIFSIHISAVKLIGDIPFYHEQAVSDSYFSGLSNRSFYTRESVKGGIEYITSIYRDFLFTGPYVQAAYFRGSGYDKHGMQFSAAGGVTGRYIFWDQFEARMYAGKDYLRSEKKIGFNMSFSVEKKF